MLVTSAQRRFFEAFGYMYFPALFNPNEIAWIIEEFEYTMQEHGNGKAHDGSERTVVVGPLEHRAKLCTLLDDKRILAVIGAALGEDFNYAGGDGNYYSGDTAWHPDCNWGRLFSCKVAFYMDPLTRDTGCLRVIPGSHQPQHFIRAQGINPNQAMEAYGVPPRDFPGHIALETHPGDVVIFNHDLYHAAFGGNQQRRMFTLNLTQHCTSPEDIATLYEYLRVHSSGGYKLHTGAGMYYPLILDTANEQRLAHMQQVIAIHDELFPELARQ